MSSNKNNTNNNNTNSKNNNKNYNRNSVDKQKFLEVFNFNGIEFENTNNSSNNNINSNNINKTSNKNNISNSSNNNNIITDDTISNNNNNKNSNNININSNSKTINSNKMGDKSPPTANNNNIFNTATINSGNLKFNLNPIHNIDIDEIGDKISNFKIVDNSIVGTSSSTNSLNISNTSNNSNSNSNNNININNNNTNNILNTSVTSNTSNASATSIPIVDSSNGGINYGSSNGIELNNSSSYNLNSSISSDVSATSPTMDSKSKRRFSLYVYQHPTDEQRRHISELYGYKEHNNEHGYKEHNNDHGYKYTHDSGLDTEDSDSYNNSNSGGSKRNIRSNSESDNSTNSSPSFDSSSSSTSTKHYPTTIPPSQSSGSTTTTTTTTNTTAKPINKNATATHLTTTLPPSSIVNSIDKVLEPAPIDLSQIPLSYFSANYKSTQDNYKQSSQYLDDEYDEKKASTQPIQPPLSTTKDWNAEFQNLVYNNKIEGYRKLSKLAHDFVYTAKIYGKVIISELSLPLHLKTIKPINIGGVAGGHKYIALGILFKLALDSQGLYAGDQNAMKAAGHELKGLMSYYNCRVEGLHHPLMALIDYRGYRLVAMSLLPINSDTIVYGSSDGGITVNNSNEDFNQKMIESAKILNIKGHMVGKDESKLLYSCGDIEGHIGSDGNKYLLDFARVFPPQMKLFDKGPPTHLFELIRPELVKSNSVALSSDALTGWGKFDALAVEHNNQVKEASFRLFLKVIPELATFLNNLDSTDKREIHLTQELHRVGVNCRHMGLVRRLVKCKSIRKLMLNEIMARTMKSEIMLQFRRKMDTDTPSEEPFKEVVVTYLNALFKFEESTSSPHNKVWPKSLKKSIEKKFIGTFQINDTNSNQITFEKIQGKRFDEDAIKRYIKGASFTQTEEVFIDAVDIPSVMKRFNQLTGVGLTSRALREITKNDGVRLVQSDVKRMKAKVKAHHLVEFAEGMVLWDEAKKEKSREKIEGAFCPCPVQLINGDPADKITDRLFGLADEHFRSALSVSPHSAEVTANWAMMLMERARMSRECVPQEADLYYNAAEEKVRSCLADGGKPKIALENVLLEYSEFLCIWGTTTDQILDLSEANGLKSRVFSRASKKLLECVKLSPSKFALVLQKSKIIDNLFHQSSFFKQSAAVYAAVCTICDCLIQSFSNIPSSYYREIAEVIIQNLNPIDLMKSDPDAHTNPIISGENMFEKIKAVNEMPLKNVISMRKDENEINQLLETNPLEILKAEMGVMYLRYGYTSHVYGIQCSKRSHTKMASIKLFNKTGGLFQRGIDMDSYNKDFMLDHIKKFTSSSQFVEFYQSIIGCPCIMEFVKDRLSRIAHMSLKDCHHLSIEFVEGVIELSHRVRMLVLDGCTQITNDTIKLIVRKLPHLETLSLAGCSNVSTIIPNSMLKEYQIEKALEKQQQQDQAKSENKICSIFSDKCGSSSSSSSSPLTATTTTINNNNLNGLSIGGGLSTSGSNQSISSSGSSNISSSQPITSPSHRHSISGSLSVPFVNQTVNNLTASTPSPVSPRMGGNHVYQGSQSTSNLHSSTISSNASNTSPFTSTTTSVSISTSSSLESLNSKPFTFLQNLNLNDCKSINDHQLLNIAHMQLPLVNVYLKRCNITDLSVIQLVQNCSKLSILELSYTNITDASIISISTGCLSLRELYLDGCLAIGCVSIEKLVRSIHDIRLLSLAECPAAANDNTLRLIGKYCANMHYLTFSSNTTITDSGVVSMAKHTVNLLELNINHCVNLSDASINQIAISCTKIRVLRMIGLNNVTSLKSIGNHSMDLVYLDISECHKISTGLGAIAKGCSKLTTFKLKRCYGFKDASLISDDGDLHLMTRLSVLNWSYSNILFDAIHSISHSCQYLTSLNISYCKGLNDNALERIANSLINIKKLKFDGIINITDDGVKSLSDGPIFNSIEVLSMVGCRKISDISAYHILRFNNLRKLSIGGSLMTTNGVDIIASSSFELVKIHVRNCLNINTASLKENHPHILIDTTTKDFNVFC